MHEGISQFITQEEGKGIGYKANLERLGRLTEVGNAWVAGELMARILSVNLN